VTATQLRDVADRIIDAGHWQQGDPPILIVADAGYDVTRLAFVLADLPVEVVGRIRSDRVMLRPAPPRAPGTSGRPRKHGGVFTLADPNSWHTPDHTTHTDTTRYGHAQTQAWDRLHPRLTHRGPWLDHDGELPLVEGTLIRLQVEHPGRLPPGEEPVHGLPRREVHRQRPPLAAVVGYVADRVDNLAPRVFLRAATQRTLPRRLRQQRLQQRPLSFSGIGGIAADTAR
jgi:hypothetical protein